MNQLLEQLRAKDPETYAKYDSLELATYKQYDDYGHTEEYIYADDLIEAARAAWLQAVLQEAISSRGWASTLTYNPPDGPEAPHWSAHIWPDEHCQMSHKADSPAEALLAAYVAALG